MLIAALIMSCAVLGSSLTITVGVKMFFEHQKHADAGESKHDATARLADVAVRNVETAESAQSHANCGDRACCAYSAKVRKSVSILLSWLKNSVSFAANL